MGGRGSGRPPSRRIPSKYRSGWLWRADKRAAPVRAVVEHALRVAQDLGGPGELSQVESDLVVRFAFVCEQLDETETEALAGKPIDTQLYLSRIDRVVRLAQLIGTKRRSRAISSVGELVLADEQRRRAGQAGESRDD